jgi:hypothetical protein
MSRTSHINKLRVLRNAGLVLLLFTAVNVVFAVDGNLKNGGGSKTSSTSFSHLKKDLNFSLRDNFTYRSYHNLGMIKTDRSATISSLMTIQKGNVTIAMPYRQKVVLQKFKTPSAPSIR